MKQLVAGRLEEKADVAEHLGAEDQSPSYPKRSNPLSIGSERCVGENDSDVS